MGWRSCPIGKGGRQGDIYAYAIKDFNVQKSTITENRQLAPGTSSGSRHTVSDNVTVYQTSNFQKEQSTPFGFMIMGLYVYKFPSGKFSLDKH